MRGSIVSLEKPSIKYEIQYCPCIFANSASAVVSPTPSAPGKHKTLYVSNCSSKRSK